MLPGIWLRAATVTAHSKVPYDGLITKEKNGRHYMLNLTERGQQAFTIAHQAFFDWDAAFMTGLTPKEKAQLLALLEKAAERIPHHVRNDQ